MGKALNSKVVSLAGRLAQIWVGPDTSDAHRKTLLRCLIEEVFLDRGPHDITLFYILQNRCGTLDAVGWGHPPHQFNGT